MKKLTMEEIEKNIKVCKNCGYEYYSTKDEFKCTKCGHLNDDVENEGK